MQSSNWTATEIGGLIVGAFTAGAGFVGACAAAALKLWPMYREWRDKNQTDEERQQAAMVQLAKDGSERVIVMLLADNSRLNKLVDDLSAKYEAMQQRESNCEAKQARLEVQVEFLKDRLAKIEGQPVAKAEIGA